MNKPVLIAAGAAALVLPTASEAHIKWFCSYDTTVPPLPLQDVLTPTFLVVTACFTTLMFVAYALDGEVRRNGWLARIERALLAWRPFVPAMVRATVFVFFLVLWLTGGTILTPELKTTAAWVPWLQLAVALSALWRPALAVSAAGIVVLYLYAVAQYGAFHMMDYPVFLGIAAYLGLYALDRRAFGRLGLPALYFNVALTMMWGAIEKFGYPYWTLPLLTDHAALTLGIPFDRFMIVAGFVEFSLAFFMVTGTALLRLSCLALLTLLTSAIPEFGRIDAIGHFPIIAILLVMIVAGQSAIGLPGPVRRDGIFARSGLLTLAYVATIPLLFALYYTAQSTAGR